MNRTIWNSDRTENPSIWQYWTTAGAEEQIIQNRNKFAVEFNLSLKQPPREPGKIGLWHVADFFRGDFDHREYYKTKGNKWVILNSPYELDNPNRDERLACLGFKKIYPLYFAHAVTYVRVIEDPRSHRWDFEQAEQAYNALQALK